MQSVRECREDGGEATFNRADDGFTFFDDGSFIHGPCRSSEEGLDELGAPENTFGLTVCLTHGNKDMLVRRRLLLAIVDGKLCGADVAFEGRWRKGQQPDATSENLLDGHVQIVADAFAGEGGAHAETLVGSAMPQTPWIAPRVKWIQHTEDIEGESALLPVEDETFPGKEVNFLPGGCWVSTNTQGDRFSITVGSLPPSFGDSLDQEDDLHAAELKCVTRKYRKGSLEKVELRSVYSKL